MFIKFNFKNQKRKTNAKIETIDELKAKAQEIFGEQIVYCDFMYEDEDRELVALVDDIDLETCFEEASDNGLNRINVFIELSSPKTKQARSMSRKRAEASKNGNADAVKLVNFSSDSEEEDLIENFESSPETSPEPRAREEIEAEIQAKKAQKIAKVESKIEEKKRKMEEKIAKKIAKLEAKKNKKLEKISQKKELLLKNAQITSSDSEESSEDEIPEDKPWMKHIPKHHRRRMRKFGRPNHHGHHGPHSHRGPHKRHHHHKHNSRNANRKHCHGKKARGPFGFIFKTMQAFRKASGENPELVKAREEAHDILKSLKRELKPLKHFPKMMLKVLNKAGPAIKAELQKAIEETKTEHPNFAQRFDANLEKREQNFEEKQARREERLAAKKERQEQKRILREQRLLEKEERRAAKLAKRQEKIEAKAAKKAELELAKANKEAQEVELGVTPNPLQAEAKAQRQAQIRERVQMLFPIFSNTMSRPEIRKEVVKELNKGLPVQDTIKRLFNQTQAE